MGSLAKQQYFLGGQPLSSETLVQMCLFGSFRFLLVFPTWIYPACPFRMEVYLFPIFPIVGFEVELRQLEKFYLIKLYGTWHLTEKKKETSEIF